MNINKFTQKSMQAVNQCERVALEYGNQEIEQEHLLYGLLTQEDSLILKLMEKMGIDKNTILERTEEALRKRTKVQGGQQFIGQDLIKRSSTPKTKPGRWGMNMYPLSTFSCPS